MIDAKPLFDSRVGFYESKDSNEELDLVYPNPRPEEDTMSLGLLDRRQPFVWVPITVVIDNRDNKVTYDRLKTGLEFALGQYPWFAGNLEEDTIKISSAWFSKEYSDSDFKFDEIDTSFNVVPYEFQFKKAIDTILDSTSKPAPVFAAKATFVKDNCVVLTTLTSHKATDGVTISNFLKFWADSTNNPGKVSLKPVIKSDPFDGDVFAMRPNYDNKTSLSSLSFKISLQKLEMLQFESNKYTNSSISKEDIFVALYWRVLTRARHTNDNITLLRAMSIHSSKEFNLGLGNKYINVFSFQGSPELFISKPVEDTAQQLRSSLPAKGAKVSHDLIAKSESNIFKMSHFVFVTSHRMMYNEPVAFCEQASKVHIHMNVPDTVVIQPADGDMMFATTCMNTDIAEKFKSDSEVASYGIRIDTREIN